MNAVAACRSYLGKLPSAVSGAGGHPATFRAACECVRFGLSDGDASTLLREWNGTHCQPPWTEKELAHKLADARRVAVGRVRAVIQRPPAVRVVWKITRKATVQPPAEPLPKPSDPLLEVWCIRPGAPIPTQFVDVLRSWQACRLHPAWRNHPQLGQTIKQSCPAS